MAGGAVKLATVGRSLVDLHEKGRKSLIWSVGRGRSRRSGRQNAEALGKEGPASRFAAAHFQYHTDLEANLDRIETVKVSPRR